MTDRSSITTTEPVCPQCGAPVDLPDYADMTLCAYCGSTLEREHVRVLQKEWEEGGERQRLRSVKCSQCAGSLSVYQGKRLLVCDHCGVRTVVLDEGGVSRWYFPARVDRRKAASAAKRWLRTYPGIDRGFREATLVQTKLVYAPIWEHRVLAAGWEYGRKLSHQMTRSPLGGASEQTYQPLEIQLVKENVKEARLNERRFYLPATDFGALGAWRPRVTGRELLVPLLAGEIEPYAVVLDAEGDGSEVTTAGRGMARQPVTGADDPQMHVYLFRESISLLYYPLWVLRYRKGGADGTVVVSGRHDSVNSAVVPADLRSKKTALAARMVGLILLAAALVCVGLLVDTARPAAIVAVLPLGAAIWSALAFRPEKEVEYHDPYAS